MSVPEKTSLLDEEQEQEEHNNYGTPESSMDPTLYIATTQGDILEFIRAMEKGAIIHTPYTPLATCIQLAPQNNTILHLATSGRHHEIVKLICKDLPFFVAEKNSKGDTALHIAARDGDLLMVKLLIESEFMVAEGGSGWLWERNEEGNSALHEALRYRHEKVARALVDEGKNVGCTGVNREGESVVYLAAEAGFVDVVSVLMENPIGNVCGGDGRKMGTKLAVFAALLGRNIDILRILWEKDQSSFQLRCKQGRNPLHIAANIGYLEGALFLLNKNSSLAYQRDTNGLFPFHLASTKGHMNIIQEMLKHCPDSRDLLTLQGQNILHVTAKSGRAKAFSVMLKMQELVNLENEKDFDGNTPLHIATINGHAKIVSTLTWDVRVNLNLRNNEGLTPLDIAEESMDTTASIPKRLTLMALRVGGAPQSKVLRTKHAQLVDQPKMENHSDKVNIVLIVAMLVATVTFTAGFTIPGGYKNSDKADQGQGIATMLPKATFQEFVIFDTIAMYTSIIVAVTLIWAQLGDLNSMRVALRYALPLLGISLAMMSMAFMTGVYLVVSELNWLGHVVLIVGSNFVVTLVALYVPLCFLGSSKYYVFRYVSYYPLRLLLHVFGSCTEGDAEE